MHCSNCSMTVEKHFNKQEGINVNVILSNNEGIFTYDETCWNEKKIEKQLKKIGYPKAKDTDSKNDLVKLILCAVFTLPFLLHMILMIANIHMPEWFKYVQLALASIVEILAGGPFLIGMIRDFKNKKLGMDVLVSLGTLTAYIYSLVILFTNSSQQLYFETCAMLLTILLLGKYIEKIAKKKTSTSLKDLMALVEKQAKVLVNDTIKIVDIENINKDDIIIVSNGEKIPLDGIVVNGIAEVDESMISGESLPVIKNIGDNLLAGTILVNGSVQFKVDKKSDETYLSTLIKKVEDIQAMKPRLQRIADKVASIFVPVVIFLSILAFTISFLTNKQIDEAITKGIAVLMISCPCSLGLATPLSILVGSSRAIKLGIIYNNTEIFEKASHIDAICFDKTGTLSKGSFEVISFTSNIDNALDIIYTLESVSSHPIAKALIDYCIKNNATLIKDMEVKEIVGKGIESKDYFIYKENQTVILKKKGEIIAKIVIVDTLKDNAKEVIEKIHQQKLKVYMFTGDNKDIALDVANKLNINKENVYYEIKPEDKLSLITSLQNKGLKVAFVGDGINDALALNKSDLSISMGSGSDIAKTSSDITLSNNKLENISSSIRLSKKVYRNILENFAWAFSYNLIAIPLAFFGVLSPMIAGACMAFSNITVVCNALRLYKVRIGE